MRQTELLEVAIHAAKCTKSHGGSWELREFDVRVGHFLSLTQEKSVNAWINVYFYMESDHSHTAYRIRMPQPQAAYAYRVYGILA